MGEVDVVSVVEAARDAPSSRCFERRVLEELGRAIGCDAAVYVRPEGPATAVGLRDEPGWRHRVVKHNAIHERELAAFRARVMKDGVGVDSALHDHEELRRTHYFRDLIEPESTHPSGARLYGVLLASGQHVGTVMVARMRRGFHDDEVLRLRRALATLTVCELAIRARTSAPFGAGLPASLSPRERELLDFLRLGFGNRAIAEALGTSPNTVRNQLSKLYAKLEASGRAEAVARAFETQLASPTR